MQRDFQSLRDAVTQELDEMGAMGEDVATFFEGMSHALEEDFTRTLERTLSEVRHFEQDVSRMFVGSSLGRAGSALGDMLGDALAAALPDSLWGNAFGSALSGALQSSISQLFSKGGVDMRSVLGAANRSGTGAVNHSMRTSFDKTPSQQAAEEAQRLEGSKRNL